MVLSPFAVIDRVLTSDHLLALLVCASGIGYFVLRAVAPGALERLVRLARAPRVWVSACVLFLGVYLVTLLLSTAYLGYLQHVEPQIAGVAFIALHGAPIYHGLASAQRYALLYGPLAYLPFSLALAVLGASVLSLKIVVLLANAGLVAALWRCYRHVLSPARALLVTAGVLSLLLLNDYLFQVRGDVMLVLSVAVGLLAVLGRSSMWSAAALAVSCAFAFDIKFSALLYFFPLYILCIQRSGWRPAIGAAVGAAALAMLPFVLPQVSVTGYLDWLHEASRHPLDRGSIMPEAKILAMILAPVVLLLWSLGRSSRAALSDFLRANAVFLLALGGCVAGIGVLALKIGAGAHHFMPFYPIVGYVYAVISKAIADAGEPAPAARPVSVLPLLWCWAAAVLLVAQRDTGIVPTLRRLIDSRSYGRDVTSDLTSVMTSHPGESIEMGYGDLKGYSDPDYRLTYFRPALVFAGNPFTVDPVALDDAELSGLQIPDSTLAYLGACKTRIWLIPRGAPPFVLLNIYSLMDPALPREPLFSAAFRNIFLQRYQKQGSSRYFDIWECTPSGDQSTRPS